MMIEERVTLGTSPQEVMQEHLSRYYFALDYVKNKTVLDIACGTGYGSHILSEKAAYVIGADISLDALNYALEHYQENNINFVECNALSIPFEDNSFDVVISFETLEHIKNYQKFISECRRVLKPDGVFIVSTPNSKVSSPNGIIINPYHVIEFDPVEFSNLLFKEFDTVKLRGQSDVNMFSRWINGNIVKTKERLKIKKRILKQPTGFSSVPVSNFKDGLTKSAYMIAVCK